MTQCRTVGDLELVDFTTLVINKVDFAVSLERDELDHAFVISHVDRIAVYEGDESARGRGPTGFCERPSRRTTGMERSHRELRTRLTDRLSGDDSDRESSFDGLAG